MLSMKYSDLPDLGIFCLDLDPAGYEIEKKNWNRFRPDLN